MDNPTSPATISPKPPISLNLAFLIITLVSLLLSVFFIYQNWRLNQKLEALIKNTQPTPTPSPIVEVTSTPDPIANWKIYTDRQNRYSIMYPMDFEISDYTEGNYKGIALGFIGEKQKASGRTETELSDGVVVKTIVIDNPTKSIEQYAQEQRKAEGEAASQIITSKLGNQIAYEFTANGWWGKTRIIYSGINNYVIRFSANVNGSDTKISEYVNLTNQILSTFKFTKENLLDSIFSVTPPDPFRLMRSTENIASYGFDTVEYLVVTNIPTIKLQALRSSTECSKLTAGQYCLYSEGTGQTKDIADVTVGGIPAKSFYISGGNDNAYHVVQTTQAPILEFKMFVAGGGLDQRFQNFLDTIKFL